jgi:glycosyltransferase involved in cell wall biosynthesis
VAIERYGDRIPVIHDVHDMQSLRHTPYEDGFPEPRDPAEWERLAVEGAAALVTVSPELVDELAARYTLPQRVMTFPNYALRRDLPEHLPPPDRPIADGGPRVVYQGSLSTLGGHYDLRDTFAEIARAGVRLDVHPARPAPAYEELAEAHPGMTVHKPLSPARLLERLPDYDLGWAGFNATLNRAHLDTALPNKAFEYIGCGLPVVTMAHRALAQFVRRERLGIVLARPGDLPAALAETDLPALRRQVASARMDLTMEANIGALTDLYRDLVGSGSAAALRPAREARS